jgi:hypothetical protein
MPHLAVMERAAFLELWRGYRPQLATWITFAIQALGLSSHRGGQRMVATTHAIARMSNITTPRDIDIPAN